MDLYESYQEELALVIEENEKISRAHGLKGLT